MSLTWAERMPEQGRLSQSNAAWIEGYLSVVDPKMSCAQTLHISLFFDGTNNNDDRNNPWRDSLTQTHTNVARLYNLALEDHRRGIFPFYIPGVGTPFPEIGETLYWTKGKALGKGFNERCVWAYTRVLNAVYNAITHDPDRGLIHVSDARTLCNAGARGDMQGFEAPVRRLGVAHRQAVDESRYPHTVRQIWINVIGFSRGAAAARAFVHKLVNEWTPNGQLGTQTGRYALPYQVNFMGLFDTVASVGLPDSTRAAVDLDMFDGHEQFARGGALNIPESVRTCYHAISIHEQRMSFPLDSIACGDDYPGGIRHEVAYPGMHSDVGGGYAPGSQGKARDGDGSKLSQIPLHDMYIAALKYGVPLQTEKSLKENPKAAEAFTADFALHPATVTAFNGWRKTTCDIASVADALKFGMSQLLAWRTLRAQVGTACYLTEQPFFQHAREDTLTPRRAALGVEKAKETDAPYLELQTRLARAQAKRTQAYSSPRYPQNMPEVIAADEEIADLKQALRIRTEALSGEIAFPDANPPRCARPGEGASDLCRNDQTDLRQGAEEMRLLLAHLHPEQREECWQVRQTVHPNPADHAYPSTLPPVLSVRRDRSHRRDSTAQPHHSEIDSPAMTLAASGILLNLVWSTLLSQYDVDDDVLAAPVEGVVPFLKRHTSQEAIAHLKQFAQAAIDLFDNHVHDSRCGFRVPHFHEYAPGGYGWPRVFFAGGDTRVRYLGMASDSQLATD